MTRQVRGQAVDEIGQTTSHLIEAKWIEYICYRKNEAKNGNKSAKISAENGQQNTAVKAMYREMVNILELL